MQLTYEGIWQLPQEQQQSVHDLMRRYQAVFRIAFKRLVAGQTRQEIVESIRHKNILSNARYIRSAIEEAKALIQSQHELVKLHYEETTWKTNETGKELQDFQENVAKRKLPPTLKQVRKERRLKRRYQKALTNQRFWETHKKNKTFPTIVFGGKKRLRAYQQGKMTKDEWKKQRSNGIYCVGEKGKKGNANLRIHYEPLTDDFTFSMLLDRGKRNERLTTPLLVPNHCKTMFQEYTKGKKAYSIRVKFSSDWRQVRVLVSSEHENKAEDNQQGIAGLDINPKGIAVTLLYPDGNFRVSKWFSQPELMYARKKKREWLIGNLVKAIFRWISSYGINTLSIEDLHFSKKYGKSREFNRIKSNFVYRKLINTCFSQALKNGFVVREVNPAFTSKIGKRKYARKYGLNDHQAAAIVISRRGLGFPEILHGHVSNHHRKLVVPPMEGWRSKQMAKIARDIDEFTAHLSNPMGLMSLRKKRQMTAQRQGSGRGIVPHSHTPTAGTSASGSS